MAINILIGVGGTGAKVVEAALVQLIAGMVQDSVYVGLVDQDLANGNVARTKALLTRLNRFRQLWSEDGRSRIDWQNGAIAALGETPVLPLYQQRGGHEALYRPNGTGENLQQMLGRGLSQPQAHLFDLLFMNSDEEQGLQLDEGYRGRAHVGSAAFLATLAGDPLQNQLFGSIRRVVESSAGQQVNVFFAGSAFGGTGAAGFPTLARRLYRLREERAFADAGNICIGGLLMLPYFNFNRPDDKAAAAVTPDELLPKTKLALEYYHSLFQHEPSFNMFYALGWPHQYPLGYHEPGANAQANPPLLPELIGASAAVHFFRQPAEYIEDRTKTFLSAHRDGPIDWHDLPSDLPEKEEYLLRLGQLLRFCVYWRYLFRPELSAPIKGFLKQRNWAQKIADGAHPDDFPEPMRALDDLVASILTWFASIEATARSGTAQRLWSLARFRASHTATPVEPVRLADSIDPKQWDIAFNSLVAMGDARLGQNNAAAVYEELVNSASHSRHHGIGKAVARVFHACRIR